MLPAIMGVLLQTRRTLIRAPRVSDAAAIARYANERTVGANTFIPFPYRLSDAHEFIKRARASWRKGTEYTFMIVDRESNEAIGGTGLNLTSSTHKVAETGYWLASPYRKQGLLTECLPAVLRFGFQELRLHRITAHVFKDNDPSKRLLTRLGFREEGYLVRALKHRGRWRDSHLFALLCEEFKTL